MIQTRRNMTCLVEKWFKHGLKTKIFCLSVLRTRFQLEFITANEKGKVLIIYNGLILQGDQKHINTKLWISHNLDVHARELIQLDCTVLGIKDVDSLISGNLKQV